MKGSITSCVAEEAGIGAQQHWQVYNICLSRHWLAQYINIQRAQRLSPHINRPKTTMGSHSKHQALTFAQHPQRRGKAQMFQLCGNTSRVSLFLRLCSSSVSFFSLSRQPFSWLRLEVVWHTWFRAEDSRGMRGGGRSRRSEPARRRQLNGSVLFRQSPSSLVITVIRGFQVQLQAHLFVRLCVGFVWVFSCLCHAAIQILVPPQLYS